MHSPDDAAVVRVPPGKAMAHTGLFPGFHRRSVCVWPGGCQPRAGRHLRHSGEPQTATAIVTVPPGLESKVEELLLHMMSGAMQVLNAANCALVGHTGEGKELAPGSAPGRP